MERTILYVDPNDAARDRFRSATEAADGLRAVTLGTAQDALERFDPKEHDVVVTASSIGTEEIGDLFARIRGAETPVPCIIFTDEDITDLLEDSTLATASAIRSRTPDGALEDLIEEIQELLRPRSEIDYPVPDDEEDRITAIQEIDIESLRGRAGFTRLAKIAQAFFDVRYAFVGIVGTDTEEFLAFEGDDVQMLPRDCSICTFGILDDETTVVDDRQKDARFRYVEELEDLDIVFYAGHPLIDDAGRRIGMFCIMDDTTRSFTETDREHLQLFAEQTMELIQLYTEGRPDGDA